MELVITRTGEIRCIYGEAIALSELGPLRISRASHVEPDSAGNWWADLRPVGGPLLGPHPCRSLALVAELGWLHKHWLVQG